jgi:hypothetical protein
VKAEHPDGTPAEMIAGDPPLREYFRSHYWREGTVETRAYRPITVLSYALTYRWLGRALPPSWEAFPQHLLNLLLHLLAVPLVFALVRRVGASAEASLAAAAVFALHAIHSEVVAGIVGRSELLAFGFGAGALLLFTSDARGAGAGLERES